MTSNYVSCWTNYKSNPEQNLCVFSETKVIYICTPMQLTKHSLYSKHSNITIKFHLDYQTFWIIRVRISEGLWYIIYSEVADIL